MAYRRKKVRVSHRKRAFSKKEAKAIKAISQQPVETKHYPLYAPLVNFLNDAGYISGPNFIVFRNVYSGIPRADNSLTKDENTFQGNEIMSRGIRWELHAYASAVSAGGILDVQFRWTLFSMPLYVAGTGGLGPADPRIFDQDHNTTPTWSKWNVQAIKIHKQHTFKMDNNGNLNSMVRRKFYVPLRRKITAAEDASLVANSFMAEIKNMQVYWALECFVPGFASGGDLRGYMNGSIDTSVYFKDA